MPQTLTIHTATVKFPAGKTFTTQYGDRVNAVLIIPATGEEIKLWGNPGDPTLSALKKGQQVAVAQDQKGWKLINTPPAAESPASEKPTQQRSIEFAPLSPADKQAIASYIDQLGDLYGYCQRVTATKNLAEGGGEDARTIATTLFIQAVKKFNL
jgi:hypothetical protein